MAEQSYTALMAGKLKVVTGIGTKFSKFMLGILPASIPLKALGAGYGEKIKH